MPSRRKDAATAESIHRNFNGRCHRVRGRTTLPLARGKGRVAAKRANRL
jgi:hypothetical protein